MAKKHTEHPEHGTETTPETSVKSRETSRETGDEHAETAPTALERTAESAENLSEAIHEGARDAREAVAGFIPAVGNFLHKGIYNGFYYLAYGAVFGSLVVGSLVPSNSVVSEGVRDGAQAAKKAFEEKEEAAEAGPTEEGLATS